MYAVGSHKIMTTAGGGGGGASAGTTASSLLSSAQFRKRFAGCFGAALEAWAHALLYQRRVYPSSTFTASAFLGVRFHVCRHPGVVSYVTDTLRVAVPALVSGAANELALTIVDTQDIQGEEDGGGAVELERYVLRFHFQLDDDSASMRTVEAIERMERGLRDLVLSALALEHGRCCETNNSNDDDGDSGVSFRISLRVPEEDRTCAELNEAFATGAWYAPSSTNESGDGKAKASARVIRPLHQFSDEAVGSIQFAMLKSRRHDNMRKLPPT